MTRFHRRQRMLEDLDRDIRDHLEQETQDNIARGLPPDEARYAALRKFGNITRAREDAREVWSLVWLEQFLQDLRFGLRSLAQSPGFTAVAVITLALGIGANTAIFSVVDAVLLRPLPYDHAEQLVRIIEAKPEEGVKEAGTSFFDFEDIRAQNHVFSYVAGNSAHELTLTGRGEPSVVTTWVVTPDFMKVMGAQPLAGRAFSAADGATGAAPVVIVSENLWRSRLGSDPGIIGSSIALDQRAFTVVGIMPASFHNPLGSETEVVWIPAAQDPVFSTFLPNREIHSLRVTARLKAGVSLAQAQAEMDTIEARLASQFPAADKGWIVRLEPMQEEIVGGVRRALLVLLGAVGLVLLIACANIANLLLARATTRVKELAVRIALGAARARIIRQLLTESILLGLIGGVAGIALAYWGVRALAAMLPESLPHLRAIRVDGSVLAFALALSIVASVVFGLAPAFFSADANVYENLKEGADRAGESSVRRRARDFLAVAEIALAMVLLVAAGLLLRSFATLIAVNPGFDPRGIVKAEVSLPQFEYSTRRQWVAFADQILPRIQVQPGMSETAIGIPLPLTSQQVDLPFDIPGSPAAPSAAPRAANYVSISPNYFRVMKIPLLRGREFRAEDSMSAPYVTIISEALAHQYFPNQDPIGKHISFAFPPTPGIPREIVGVVAGIRNISLNKAPGAIMYVPFAQTPLWGAQTVTRSTMSASSVAAVLREQVSTVDKNLPVTDVSLLEDDIEQSVAQPKFRTVLLGLFGALALVLAAAGIFGVISYSVSRRTREIGIRIALGATPSRVVSLVLGESAKLVAVGLVLGIAGALGLGRFLSGLLFSVRPADPVTFVSVGLLLAAVAFAASYIPTRRARRVDPIVALRCE